MKLSVSLPEKDVEFLDFYITMHDLESRSAALQAALKALRDLDLQDQYEAAWAEEEDPEVLAHWQRKWDDWEKKQALDASW
jgi:Arc/MetJ-type ribon-helix-helix transcriptional regulator